MQAIEVIFDIFREQMSFESYKFLTHFLVSEIYFPRGQTLSWMISIQKNQNLLHFERIYLLVNNLESVHFYHISKGKVFTKLVEILLIIWKRHLYKSYHIHPKMPPNFFKSKLIQNSSFPPTLLANFRYFDISTYVSNRNLWKFGHSPLWKTFWFLDHCAER